MKPENFEKIRQTISPARLEAYRENEETDLRVLARYMWNMALCESIYPPLQVLEVSLRNSLHKTITEHFGRENWYDPPSPLHPKEARRIVGAKNALTRDKKPHDPNRIVAELNLGFWTSLFDVRYEHNQILWPKLMKKVFPYLPKYLRTRRNVSSRFTDIRRLRNRVFHHERILHWKDLARKHADMIDAIGWNSPDLQKLVRKTSRFLEIHEGGIARWEDMIEGIWPEKI